MNIIIVTIAVSTVTSTVLSGILDKINKKNEATAIRIINTGMIVLTAIQTTIKGNI